MRKKAKLRGRPYKFAGERKRALQMMLTGKFNVTQIARELGVSRQIATHWFRRAGIEPSLLPTYWKHM